MELVSVEEMGTESASGVFFRELVGKWSAIVLFRN
jgi:hypothetical protein